MSNRGEKSREQTEISISEDRELSHHHEKKRSTFRSTISTISTIFDTLLGGSPSFSSLSLKDDDKLEEVEVLEEKIEEHRTLFLINKEDKDLYDEINKWVKDNPKATLKDTILKFDPKKNRKCDALAKVVHDYEFPDFIIKYRNNEDSEDEERREKQRRNFEILLLVSGLILEHELDADGDCTYVKVIAPFERLCEQAQQIKLKMRLNEKPKELPDEPESIFKRYFSHKIDQKKESSFFKKDQLRNFKGAEGAESEEGYAEISLNFFSTARRNLLVHRMIITANQIDKKMSKDGAVVHIKRKIDCLAISKLLDEGVYDKFYPIHDGPPSVKDDEETPRVKDDEKTNLRAQLNESWVKSRKRQPIKEIREYFGEKFALYFAWLGFYTSWLSVASIAGVIVVIYGIICAKRKSHEYEDADIVVKISPIWDNALTAPYAFFMAVWATCFLESWKRANASIQYDWDVIDFEKEELPRPEFYGTTYRQSKITLKREIHFPFKAKLVKLFVSGIIVAVSIGIVIVTVGVLIHFPKKWWKNNPNDTLAKVTPVITGLINLATIIILNMVYRNVARFLTNFENHKTETQFEDSLIFKTYLFDFINFYSALIYILLFKQIDDFCLYSINDKGGNNNKVNTCMNELTIQLAIILVGKQMIGQIQEILIPWLISKWYKASTLAEREKLKNKYDRKHKEVPQWVQDDTLASSQVISNEYEEIVIQFGFITLFGIAFPLAPLFAFINNITEVRSDAFKYIKTLQRPVGFLAQDLGMWEKIMSIVSLISVLTNAIIIAFHSRWMDELLRDIYDNDENKIRAAKLWFILIFEHLVFIIKLVFAYMIPDVPSTVKIAIERERYFSKLTLEKEQPALDEYLSDSKDDASLFREGSLLLPRRITSGENIIDEKSSA